MPTAKVSANVAAVTVATYRTNIVAVLLIKRIGQHVPIAVNNFGFREWNDVRSRDASISEIGNAPSQNVVQIPESLVRELVLVAALEAIDLVRLVWWLVQLV
ncbi:uncharacterized protein SPSK_08130 [Sporothrix schenckii 1099-18]|uniref:Uncharacterized protein n=1 Tax=Sporothrix schenckii 1099-18 TaxID=1397361 RepID=A0A0F2MHQ4_SPOSC|nr:uncharacterized protein SPSK_08130 [Sporothrix schenckii 1099-18]KJR87701.1 hypothetical protein SPSK_08130 [Sporothrix schenckii 1099-18]